MINNSRPIILKNFITLIFKKRFLAVISNYLLQEDANEGHRNLDLTKRFGSTFDAAMVVIGTFLFSKRQ